MGCTTSVVLLEGLRSILERNCSYIKGAVELGDLEEEEETLSLRGSQLWMPTTALVKPALKCYLFAVVYVGHFQSFSTLLQPVVFLIKLNSSISVEKALLFPISFCMHL